MNWLNYFAEFQLTWIATWAILNALWQGVAIWVLHRLFFAVTTENNCVARYRVGLVALVAAIVLPVVTACIWHPRADVSRQTLAPSIVALPNGENFNATMRKGFPAERMTERAQSSDPNSTTTPAELNLQDADCTDAVATNISTKGSAKQSLLQFLSTAAPILVIGWILGVCLFAIRPIIGFHYVWKLKRQGLFDVEPDLQQRFDRQRIKLGMARAIEIYYSKLIRVPTVVGVWRPIVLLPISVMSNLTVAELDSILRHELAHIRRYDTLLNIFQITIETLLFFHPLVWAISKTVQTEREKCCDDISATSDTARTTLAKALIQLEENRQEYASQLSLTSHSGDLKKRVTRLLDLQNTKRTNIGRLLGLVVAGVMVAAFIFATVQTQAVASNSDPAADEKWEVTRVTVENMCKIYKWKKLTSKTKHTAKKIADVFPNLDSGKRGKTPAGWEADLIFKITKRNTVTGKTKEIRVAINFEKGLWSEGNGDWPFGPTWAYRYAMADLIRENKDWRIGRVNEEAEVNWKTYHENKAVLAKIKKGKWVVIAGGRLTSSFENFDQAVEHANKAHANAFHRFIFRPGIDDVNPRRKPPKNVKPENLLLSPRNTGTPHWIQIGTALHRSQGITASETHWIRGQRKIAAPGGRAHIQIGSSEDKQRFEQVTAVLSNTLSRELTLPQSMAARLGLFRNSLPHSMTSQGNMQCPAVRCEIKIPQLNISKTVTAFVYSQQEIDKYRRDPKEHADKIRKLQDKFNSFLSTAGITEDVLTVRRYPWVVYGVVKDNAGHPIPKANVVAHFGYVDRFGAVYSAVTDAKGRYVLRFDQRFTMNSSNDLPHQLPKLAGVTIKPSKSTYIISSPNQISRRMTCETPLDSKTIVKRWPTRIDFEMEKTAVIQGELRTANDQMMQNRKLELEAYHRGGNLIQNLRYRQAVKTDALGRFAFYGVPRNCTLKLRFQDEHSGELKISPLERLGTHYAVVQRSVNETEPSKIELKLLKFFRHDDGRLGILLDQRPLPIKATTSTRADNLGLKFGPTKNGLAAAVRVKNGNHSHIENEKWFRTSRAMKFEFVIQNQSRETKTIVTSALRTQDQMSVVSEGGTAVETWSKSFPGKPVTVKVVLEPGEQFIVRSAALEIVDPEKPQGINELCGYRAELTNGAYTGKFKLNLPGVRLSDEKQQSIWQGVLETGEFKFRVGKPKQ